PMNRSALKLIRWSVLGMCVLPLAAVGQQESPVGEKPRLVTREEGAATRPAPQFGGRFEPVTDEQWNEVLPFVKDNFKNALAALDKMSDAGPFPRQARNKARIYAQVRDLRQLQDRDPERYQSRLE